MNPLSEGSVWLSTFGTNDVPKLITGNPVKSCIDKFFFEQLKLEKQRIDSRVVVSSVNSMDFGTELGRLDPTFNMLCVKPNTVVIPAHRDTFGNIMPQLTSTIKSEVVVDSTQIWIPANAYKHLAFIVFRSHASGRGWEYGFFVERKNLALVTISE